jgi:hypothetical protein
MFIASVCGEGRLLLMKQALRCNQTPNAGQYLPSHHPHSSCSDQTSYQAHSCLSIKCNCTSHKPTGQKTFRHICRFIIDNFSHFDTQLLRKFVQSVCVQVFEMRLAFEGNEG